MHVTQLVNCRADISVPGRKHGDNDRNIQLPFDAVCKPYVMQMRWGRPCWFSSTTPPCSLRIRVKSSTEICMSFRIGEVFEASAILNVPNCDKSAPFVDDLWIWMKISSSPLSGTWSDLQKLIPLMIWQDKITWLLTANSALLGRSRGSSSTNGRWVWEMDLNLILSSIKLNSKQLSKTKSRDF